MRLTHLGHACLLVEAAGARLLIDPGTYSDDFTTLTDLDAILVSHQHPDHVDTERLSALVAGNPGAKLLAEPETVDALTGSSGIVASASPFAGGQTAQIGPLLVEGVGAKHAFNHDGVPRCGNTGFVISADGEPTLFHPGDAYDGVPGRRTDVLALPLNAPWTAVRDTLEFANRLTPRWVVPIHDALLSQLGREGYLQHVDGFTPKVTQVRDLADRQPWDVSAGG
jgi:L-ascorbate metabolism protein UlaG (beta-lactamase superfamily)